MHNISIGLTHENQCSYLPDERERVAVALEPEVHTPENYELLLANGFRRSGTTIYRPYCVNCDACQSIRIPVAEFIPSKSQKRIWNKARTFTWLFKESMDTNWFELYSNYINERHQNGSMYPPNHGEFKAFSSNEWLTTRYLHVYDEDKLVAIAITDVTPNALSAFYTFFDPSYSLSFGTLGVLLQIAHAREMGKSWLYLGYQIDECSAMNYKVRFQPNQKLVNQRWQG